MMAVRPYVCLQFDLVRDATWQHDLLAGADQLDLSVPVPHATGGVVLALGLGDHFRLEEPIGDEEDVARPAALGRLNAGEVVRV